MDAQRADRGIFLYETFQPFIASRKSARPQSDCKRAQSKSGSCCLPLRLETEVLRWAVGPWVWLSHASMASRETAVSTAYTWNIPTRGEVTYLAFPKTQSWASSFVVRYLLVYASKPKVLQTLANFQALPSLKAQLLLVFQLSSPFKKEIASSKRSSPQNISDPTMKLGAPKTPRFWAWTVFSR